MKNIEEEYLYRDVEKNWDHLSKKEKTKIYNDIVFADKHNLIKSEEAKNKWLFLAELYIKEYDLFNYRIDCRHCSMLSEDLEKDWFCEEVYKKCSDISHCTFNKIK